MGEVQLDPRASSRTTTCRLDSSFSTTSTVVAISSTISRQQAGGHGSGKSHCIPASHYPFGVEIEREV